MKQVSLALCGLILLAFIFFAGSSASSTATITRVSVSSTGLIGNGFSDSPVISADGRYVAFQSDANNLVANDTIGTDIFVHDRQTGTTTRVSVTSDGSQANDKSNSPSISADGRFIVFASFASNLIPNDTNRKYDINSGWDIFVHDNQAGSTTRVSIATDGAEANHWSIDPSISADGRYVAFQSNASNLVANDTVGPDIFVHDRQAGETKRVSLNSNGLQANNHSYSPSISADGRYIAFTSLASNLVSNDTNNYTDVFVHDRQTGETKRISVASDGEQANFASESPSISPDGRYVAFVSVASNLVSNDNNKASDIFLHDRQTGETIRVSVASDGTQGNRPSGTPGSISISQNGHYVVFNSTADNLVGGSDTILTDDVFIYDREKKETKRISVRADGMVPHQPSLYPSISADGGFVAFRSHDDLLGDNIYNSHIYVYQHEVTPTPIPTVTITTEPLIFIPGISGSYLVEVKDNDTEELWPAASLNMAERDRKHQRLTLDSNQPAINVIATDVLRQIKINNLPGPIIYQDLLHTLAHQGKYVEYQVNNNPKLRTEEGCDFRTQESSHPNLFIFAYDWRKDNATSADLLADYVKCIRKFHPNSSINIIAHSMGGLVARRYILEHPGTHGIGKLISIGTPWLGAPKAIMALETGEEFAPWYVISPYTLKEILVFFPGAHQLIPSENYFVLGGLPLRENGWNINNNDKDNEIYSFTQMVNLLDSQFISNPGNTTANFHAFPDSTHQQDDWRQDESGVEYHIIFGIGKRNDTIEQVIAAKTISCPNRVCLPFKNFVVERGKGDRTVPRLSAERIGNGVDFNGTATLYRPSSGNQDHTDLTKNAEVLNLILQLLNNQNGEAHMITTMSEPPTEPAYYVSVNGIENLTVIDAAGNSTSPTNGQAFGDNIPDVIVDRMGENDYSLVLPKHQTYTITFAASGAPSQLEITDGTNITNTKLVRYLDLAIPPHVNAGFRLTPTTIEPLYVDTDGNGTPDSIIPPTADVTGSLASDTTPPSVTITHTQDGNKITVSINASDDTEVVKILYSLDGTHFDVYLGPFTLDVGQAKSIYAFADDKVANRSTLVVHTFAQNTYLPLIRQ